VSKILLVEDEALIALATESLLKKNAYDVVSVYSGPEAIETATHDPEIDLVLMDIDLGPGMDGTEAAGEILKFRQLPVVFLTSHAERHMVERVRTITRFGYVLKSSGDFVVLEAIHMALELFAAQRETERANYEYRSIAQLVGDIIVRHDAKGKWTFVNDAACRFWGTSREKLMGSDFMDFVHPDDREATMRIIEELKHKRSSYGVVGRERTPHGWRKVEWNRAPILDEHGEYAGHQSTGRDITDREAITRELILKDRAVDSAVNGIAFTDLDGTITYSNLAMRNMWECSTENGLLARNLADILRESDAAAQLIKDAAAGKEATAELTGLGDTQSTFPVHVTVTRITNYTGKLIQLMVSAVDITERKDAEEKVSRLFREKDIIQREIHHRVKNDLSLIKSLIELHSSTSRSDESRTVLREASGRISVLAHVYDQLYADPGRRNVRVKEFLMAVLAFPFGESGTSQLELRVTPSELTLFPRLAAAIGIVLNELATNSVKYAQPDVRDLHVHVTVQESGPSRITLRVADNGCGYPQRVMKEGTGGLGLTIVRTLAAQYHGGLQIGNRNGAYTEVTLERGTEGLKQSLRE